MKTGFMSGIIDMHCHILPGLDDGSQNIEETMETLRLAAAQGISAMITTSHYHPGRYMASAEDIFSALSEVQKQCEEEGLDIQLYPGQELFYHNGCRELLKDGKILTMAGSKYVLIEFDVGVSYEYLLNGLKDVRYGGYRPILAHFERYECLKKGNRLEELKQLGVLLQMNYDTLLRKNTLFHKLPYMGYVKEGLVDLFGSDTHGMHYRPLQIHLALKKLKGQVDDEILYKMLVVNPAKVLKNK